MRGLLARVRVFWRGLRRPGQLDGDMDDEMRLHIELEAQRIARERGVDAAEARRLAAIAFGGIEKYRGAARDVLGFTWTRGFSTDVTLGVRMLRKYPGLTGVAVFALALAIGAGAAYLEFVQDLLHGQLPFPDADRIVGIQQWDQQTGDPENRVTADFVAWRESLRSFDELGAYRALDRNLITDDGQAAPVPGVEISPAIFRIAGVPPTLGRPLGPEDERTGAPAVVVIGHDVWVSRFASDASVIGRTVRLGNAIHTVVGVMPDGFGFPVSHSLWVPLSLRDAPPVPRDGTPIEVFGRLAPGTGLPQAQAELTAVALRMAAEHPETHRHLRPVVKPFVQSLWSTVEDSRMQQLVFYGANLFFLALLGVCGANIATLVFARTATRSTEISVRTALGASRARIAGQLFAEALVLSSIAAVVGLLGVSLALQWVKRAISEAEDFGIMFWWDDSLSPLTFIYAAVLAIGAALVVGVVPALKATGLRVQERLKQTAHVSSADLRFGGVWTGVIVAQVSLTVVFLAIAGTLSWGSSFGNAGDRELMFPAGQYIALRLNLDRTAPQAASAATADDEEFRRRLGTLYDELANRLAAEPGVLDVTYGTRLPGMNHSEIRVEVDGLPAHATPESRPLVRTAFTGVGFLETFQARLLAGRPFAEGDLAPGRHVAIVDRTFVRQVLGGQDAVGRRFRSVEATQRMTTGPPDGTATQSGAPTDLAEARPGPWIEIVGVVSDLTSDVGKVANDAVMYRPAPATAAHPLHVAVHVAGDATAVMSRLRPIAASLDPTLRLDDLQSFEQVTAGDRVALEFFAHLLTGISAVALVLATAGVYALLSFTVARRTTEIGIRVALGANPRRIMVATFGRAAAQVALGLVAGSLPGGLLVASLAPKVMVGAGPETAVTTCLVVALFMVSVTTVAAFVPARRVLRIQPTDTLKAT